MRTLGRGADAAATGTTDALSIQKVLSLSRKTDSLKRFESPN